MTIGSKIKIRESEIERIIGMTGIIAGKAPDNSGTVYKVRVSDMVLPGWFSESQLEELHRPYTALVFDLDGTLVDSSMGIMRSYEVALEHFNIQLDSIEDLRPCVGKPAIECFTERFLLSKEDTTEAVRIFSNYFKTLGIYGQRLYPEIKELLTALKKDGFRIAVVSTKDIKDVRFTLEYLKINDLVDFVTANEEGYVRKSKADLINRILGMMGIAYDRSSCVMVGDRGLDAEAARLSGVDCIGVLWGYGSQKELFEAGARYCVQTVRDLVKKL